MAASARVVVLMSPEEKAALDAKARRAGRISAGELVRRAVNAYQVESGDDAKEAEELRTLLGVFERTHPETLRALDRVEQKLGRTLVALREMDQRG
jgi:hypothetical protein